MGLLDNIGTYFKTLVEKPVINNNVFFPIYDPVVDKDQKLGLNTLITYVQTELGLQGREIYELPNVSNINNNYTSPLPLTTYKTEGLYIVQFNVDSNPVGSPPTFKTDNLAVLPIKTYDSASNALIPAVIKSAITYVLLNRTTYWETAFSSGVSGSSKFTTDLLISLSNGGKAGKYSSGQTIPRIGKTNQEVMDDMYTENIYPTYTPATIALSDNQPDFGEVGETLSDILTANFTQNDAGVLTAIRIERNGSALTPNGTTNSFSKTDSVTRINGNVFYRAFVSYNAGTLKNISPSGLPDDHSPAIRNSAFPQASENDFGSNIVAIQGGYKRFFGTGILASNSAQVRGLANFTYNNTFSIIIAAGQTQVSFSYPSILNDISNGSILYVEGFGSSVGNTFTQTTFNVNDAGGVAVFYKTYICTLPVPYSQTATYNVTLY